MFAVTFSPFPAASIFVGQQQILQVMQTASTTGRPLTSASVKTIVKEVTGQETSAIIAGQVSPPSPSGNGQPIPIRSKVRPVRLGPTFGAEYLRRHLELITVRRLWLVVVIVTRLEMANGNKHEWQNRPRLSLPLLANIEIERAEQKAGQGVVRASIDTRFHHESLAKEESSQQRRCRCRGGDHQTTGIRVLLVWLEFFGFRVACKIRSERATTKKMSLESLIMAAWLGVARSQVNNID